jgi:hypothetical protein
MKEKKKTIEIFRRKQPNGSILNCKKRVLHERNATLEEP